jgi:hypothetical protein
MHPSEEKEPHLLTRALAAFAVSAAAKIEDSLAAASVVDESKDDGIDAFYGSEREFDWGAIFRQLS